MIPLKKSSKNNSKQNSRNNSNRNSRKSSNNSINQETLNTQSKKNPLLKVEKSSEMHTNTNNNVIRIPNQVNNNSNSLNNSNNISPIPMYNKKLESFNNNKLQSKSKIISFNLNEEEQQQQNYVSKNSNSKSNLNTITTNDKSNYNNFKSINNSINPPKFKTIETTDKNSKIAKSIGKQPNFDYENYINELGHIKTKIETVSNNNNKINYKNTNINFVTPRNSNLKNSSNKEKFSIKSMKISKPVLNTFSTHETQKTPKNNFSIKNSFESTNAFFDDIDVLDKDFCFNKTINNFNMMSKHEPNTLRGNSIIPKKTNLINKTISRNTNKNRVDLNKFISENNSNYNSKINREKNNFDYESKEIDLSSIESIKNSLNFNLIKSFIVRRLLTKILLLL
ncbi:MAG: hypothetical protein ACK5YA_00220, partial [bacterium]